MLLCNENDVINALDYDRNGKNARAFYSNTLCKVFPPPITVSPRTVWLILG